MPNKYRVLLGLIKEQKSSYTLSILFLVLASFFAFLVPYIGKLTIDRVISKEHTDTQDLVQKVIDTMGGQSFFVENLWICGVILVALTIVSGLFMFLKDYFSSTACEEIARALRNQLFHHIHHLPNKFHVEVDTGDLLQRCTSDIDTLCEFLNTQVMNIGRTIILVIVAVPLMAWQSGMMTALSICLVPIILIIAFRFFERVKKVFQQVDEAEGALTTIVQENLTGIRVVRAFAQQEFEIEKFEEKNQNYRVLHYKLMQVLSSFWSTSDFLCFFQFGLVLIGGGWLASQQIITIGTFFAFLTYTSMLIWPIRELGKELSDSGKAVVAIGRIQEILEMEAEPQPPTPVSLPERIQGAISFKDVCFEFKSDETILRNISFDVNAGEMVAIVGPTGAGKSTLIKLLLRLYDYDQGAILVDGVELKNIERKAIRSQIGTLLQEPFLYHRTLRENIKFGRKTATEHEMIESSKKASIHETIQQLEKRYETVIGERGVNLSGGQRQRVTLSRTFLQATPILILDDTLSAVDVNTEQAILKAIAQQKGQQTVLMTTHRLTSCQQADKVIVIQNGQITQVGTHATLIETPGYYQNLWKIQLGKEQSFLMERKRNVS